MIELSLQPQDFLFFKDSRPMLGASPGKGARVPMQHVLNGALHAALHRAFPQAGSLEGEKIHQGAGGDFRFGNLTSIGPFFSHVGDDNWAFPTPLDLCTSSGEISHVPLSKLPDASSLPAPLRHHVVSRHSPTKEDRKPFLDRLGFQDYLNGKVVEKDRLHCFDEYFLPEHAVGIGMDNDTRSVEKGMLYTFERMRLREEARLVSYADFELNGKDGLQELFHDQNRILVGGESRVCTVETKSVSNLNLPSPSQISGTRIKFILLTPAIFVAVSGHSGGWLPNWVSPMDGSFRLLDGPGPDKVRRLRRKSPGIKEGRPIDARLVAAHVGKPEIVSGWAKGPNGGAKSTLMAAPAGSVYYFEASDEEHAQKLVSALNWKPNLKENTQSINRRSALMGEKGYGIGVCSSWQFLEEINSK